ncbi:MAG: HD domain-containing protein, partial [Thermoanaerobaculia bacterium]|nr:HD domain-containing protein [Thermoanaerobaculia bacterium]
KDLDLAVPTGALDLAQRLAGRLGAAFVPLDRERGCARVVLPDESLELDFADFRAPSLAQDLAARDFTLNAMAVDLAGDGEVIDPTGGLADLKAKTVRLLGRESLLDDPLRGLRGVRIAAQLGFTLDATSRHLIQDLAPTLARSAAERIRDEFLSALEAPHPEHTVRELADLDLLEILLPEVTAQRKQPVDEAMGGNRFEHTLRVLGALGTSLELLTAHVSSANPGLGDAIRSRWTERASEKPHEERAENGGAGPNRLVLLRLAALLHDVGKRVPMPVPKTDHAAVGAQLAEHRLRALRLARGDARWVANVVRLHTRPQPMRSDPPLDRRFLHHFLREARGSGVEIGILMLADLAAKKPRTSKAYRRLEDRVEELANAELFEYDTLVFPKPLVSGHDLVAAEICSPGARMGVLLARLLESQVMGEISTVSEALDKARSVAGDLDLDLDLEP